MLGRLGQTITVPRAETDRLLNIRKPAALPAAYIPAQVHENSISVLKVLKLQAAATQLRAQYAATGIPATLQRKPSGHPETSEQVWTDNREIISTCCRSVSQTLQRPHTPPAGSTGAICVANIRWARFCNDNPTWQDEISPPYPSRLTIQRPCSTTSRISPSEAEQRATN